MKKKELRQVFRKKRETLNEQSVLILSNKIRDHFFSCISLEDIRVIHCFLPLSGKSEVNTHLFFQHFWTHYPNITTLVSKSDFNDGTMKPCLLTDQTPLKENTLGIPEPITCIPVEVKKIDLVIMPLLCYDLKGNRVGYGKGFYDRFLIQCRPECRKIGLSFFDPVDQIDDIAPLDVPIDAVVTPEKIHHFNTPTDSFQTR